jgi:DNA polymerase elongation subunit (family B)
MIIYAKRIIEEVYSNMIYETTLYGNVKCNAEYIYGDTDSVFFTFNLENPETGEKIKGKRALEITIEIAQDVANLCTQFLKPPMELSYEKTLWPFCLLSKKRYFGKLFEYNPDKGKLKFMGLSLKRRDNCDLLKDVYGNMLNILLLPEQSLCNKMDQCIKYLDTCLEQLIQGLVPMDKLAITKSLSGYYKNPQQIAHAVLAERIGNRRAYKCLCDCGRTTDNIRTRNCFCSVITSIFNSQFIFALNIRHISTEPH